MVLIDLFITVGNEDETSSHSIEASEPQIKTEKSKRFFSQGFSVFFIGSAELDFDNKVILWSTGSLHQRGNISTSFSGEYDYYFATVGGSGYIYLPIGVKTHCAYAAGGMWWGHTDVTLNQTAHTISAQSCGTGGSDASYGLVVYGIMCK